MSRVKEKYLVNITTTSLNNVEKTHDFTFKTSFLNLNPDSNYECALLSYSMWYSWYNITTLNNQFRYVVNGVVKTITIPSGQYGVNDISTYIQSQLLVNGDSQTGITIVGNYNLLKVQINLESGYDVDFTIPNSIRGLLGYPSLLYENNGLVDLLITAPSPGNITNSIDAISISCSILDSKYNITNNATSVSLHTFVPQSGPGTNLAQTIPTPIYLPISVSGNINSFNIRITDQTNTNLVDLNGENVSLSMLIREV